MHIPGNFNALLLCVTIPRIVQMLSVCRLNPATVCLCFSTGPVWFDVGMMFVSEVS